MNMFVVPFAMWHIFKGNFKANLGILGASDPSDVMRHAKQKYKEIIDMIPPFGKMIFYL